MEHIKNNKSENKRKDGLTEQEGEVMDSLVNAWNKFVKLERTHPCDINDFADGIHKCQYELCMRVMRRDYPEGYPTYKDINSNQT